MPRRVRFLGPLRGSVVAPLVYFPVSTPAESGEYARYEIGGRPPRVRILHNGGRLETDGVGGGTKCENAFGVLVRETPLTYLARLNRLSDSLDLLLDRCDTARTLPLGVVMLARDATAARACERDGAFGPVQLQHVDVVRLKPRKRSVNRLADLRLAELRPLAALPHPSVSVVVAANLPLCGRAEGSEAGAWVATLRSHYRYVGEEASKQLSGEWLAPPASKRFPRQDWKVGQASRHTLPGRSPDCVSSTRANPNCHPASRPRSLLLVKTTAGWLLTTMSTGPSG
eukprot:scaffold32329_cov30-Tisochrysis_lutea.AAC.4